MGKFLNRGMYDVVEVAHLLGVNPGMVVRWSTPTKSREALVPPSLEPLFSFHDLISMLVVSKLAARGVRNSRLANGIAFLRGDLGTEHPLAREELRDNLATVGHDFFARLGNEWVDIGRGGQRAFREVVLPTLRQVEYGKDHLAAIWRPGRHIWLNPRVQAGAACIEGTRVPTAIVLRAIDAGEDADDVAADYDIPPSDVRAAVQFERELQAVTLGRKRAG